MTITPTATTTETFTTETFTTETIIGTTAVTATTTTTTNTTNTTGTIDSPRCLEEAKKLLGNWLNQVHSTYIKLDGPERLRPEVGEAIRLPAPVKWDMVRDVFRVPHQLLYENFEHSGTRVS